MAGSVCAVLCEARITNIDKIAAFERFAAIFALWNGLRMSHSAALHPVSPSKLAETSNKASDLQISIKSWKWAKLHPKSEGRIISGHYINSRLISVEWLNRFLFNALILRCLHFAWQLHLVQHRLRLQQQQVSGSLFLKSGNWKIAESDRWGSLSISFNKHCSVVSSLDVTTMKN